MPDNAVYYHAAYVVASALYGAYALSLWWRVRHLRERARRTAALPHL